MRNQIIPNWLKSQWAALAHDLLMIPTAWYLAYWLRLEQFVPSTKSTLLISLGIILPVQISCFLVFGLYRGIWRFASLPDILRILKSVLIGTTISMALLFVATRADGVPRSNVIAVPRDYFRYKLISSFPDFLEAASALEQPFGEILFSET